jgi:hypothetical protein
MTDTATPTTPTESPTWYSSPEPQAMTGASTDSPPLEVWHKALEAADAEHAASLEKIADDSRYSDEYRAKQLEVANARHVERVETLAKHAGGTMVEKFGQLERKADKIHAQHEGQWDWAKLQVLQSEMVANLSASNAAWDDEANGPAAKLEAAIEAGDLHRVRALDSAIAQVSVGETNLDRVHDVQKLRRKAAAALQPTGMDEVQQRLALLQGDVARFMGRAYQSEARADSGYSNGRARSYDGPLATQAPAPSPAAAALGDAPADPSNERSVALRKLFGKRSA